VPKEICPKSSPKLKLKLELVPKEICPQRDLEQPMPKEICPKEPISNAKGDLPSKSADTHDRGNLTRNGTF
jgi:hypothetical protein